MLRYSRLRFLTKIFRFLEVCLALVFIFWIFVRLPFALQISGYYFRHLAGVVASPLFVFVLCNVIIAALFAKFGRFNADTNPESEFYREYLENSEHLAAMTSSTEISSPSGQPVAIVFHDKKIICEENATPISESDPDLDTEKGGYQRTQSEKLKSDGSEMVVIEKLRPSETAKLETAGIPVVEADTGDDLSDEQFQKAVEAFIEKQLRYRRDESMAIVVPNQVQWAKVR